MLTSSCSFTWKSRPCGCSMGGGGRGAGAGAGSSSWMRPVKRESFTIMGTSNCRTMSVSGKSWRQTSAGTQPPLLCLIVPASSTSGAKQSLAGMAPSAAGAQTDIWKTTYLENTCSALATGVKRTSAASVAAFAWQSVPSARPHHLPLLVNTLTNERCSSSIVPCLPFTQATFSLPTAFSWRPVARAVATAAATSCSPSRTAAPMAEAGGREGPL
mmetsp:Transcript_4535/g.15955  ORF Transcript_4535/g.15955 Transcript_4535/m.15955 type:complete len:215 (+) Transcript_4535:108-752(+)